MFDETFRLFRFGYYSCFAVGIHQLQFPVGHLRKMMYRSNIISHHANISVETIILTSTQKYSYVFSRLKVHRHRYIVRYCAFVLCFLNSNFVINFHLCGVKLHINHTILRELLKKLIFKHVSGIIE